MSKRDITQSLLSIRPSECATRRLVGQGKEASSKSMRSDLMGTPAPHDAKCIEAIQPFFES